MTDHSEFLRRLGQVDVEKLKAATTPYDEIKDALAVLEANEYALNDWEGDFYYDINLRFTQEDKNIKLSDKQFEILMKMAVKYE